MRIKGWEPLPLKGEGRRRRCQVREKSHGGEGGHCWLTNTSIITSPRLPPASGLWKEVMTPIHKGIIQASACTSVMMMMFTTSATMPFIRSDTLMQESSFCLETCFTSSDGTAQTLTHFCQNKTKVLTQPKTYQSNSDVWRRDGGVGLFFFFKLERILKEGWLLHLPGC